MMPTRLCRTRRATGSILGAFAPVALALAAVLALASPASANESADAFLKQYGERALAQLTEPGAKAQTPGVAGKQALGTWTEAGIS